jgi:hypothetical protein
MMMVTPPTHLSGTPTTTGFSTGRKNPHAETLGALIARNRSGSGDLGPSVARTPTTPSTGSPYPIGIFHVSASDPYAGSGLKPLPLYREGLSAAVSKTEHRPVIMGRAGVPRTPKLAPSGRTDRFESRPDEMFEMFEMVDMD